MEEILKYLTVYGLSGIKFILGPTLGIAYGFHWVLTASLTTAGMMTTVYIFTFFGDNLRNFLGKFRKKRKIFTKRNRKFVRIWSRYGEMGISLMTPLLLMPIGGAILINALGGKRKKIILWMWVSAIGHSFGQTWLYQSGFDLIKKLLA